MQRYLCIFCLAATNKVISAGGAMRQSMWVTARYRSLRNGRRPVCGRGSIRRGYGLDMQEDGDPGAIRTRDPQIRNLMLYPAELRGHPKGGSSYMARAPLCRATYVSSARAAISGNSGVSCIPLHCFEIRPKYLGIRSKVDAGCMIRLTRVQECRHRLPAGDRRPSICGRG